MSPVKLNHQRIACMAEANVRNLKVSQEDSCESEEVKIPSNSVKHIYREFWWQRRPGLAREGCQISGSQKYRLWSYSHFTFASPLTLDLAF